MPRTVEEILAHAEELAKRFEDYEPQPGDRKDATPLRAVREAFEDAARAQSRLAERVAVARAAGLSWASIGAMLGTSGEAARQRYGQPSEKPVPAKSAAKPAPVKKAPVAKAAPARTAKVPAKAAPRKGAVTKAAKGTTSKTVAHKKGGLLVLKGKQKSAERDR